MPACPECGQAGHRRANCPNVLCYRCHQRGHMRRECTSTSVERRDRSRSRNRHRSGSRGKENQRSNEHQLPHHLEQKAQPAACFASASALIAPTQTTLTAPPRQVAVVRPHNMQEPSERGRSGTSSARWVSSRGPALAAQGAARQEEQQQRLQQQLLEQQRRQQQQQLEQQRQQQQQLEQQRQQQQQVEQQLEQQRQRQQQDQQLLEQLQEQLLEEQRRIHLQQPLYLQQPAEQQLQQKQWQQQQLQQQQQQQQQQQRQQQQELGQQRQWQLEQQQQQRSCRRCGCASCCPESECCPLLGTSATSADYSCFTMPECTCSAESCGSACQIILVVLACVIMFLTLVNSGVMMFIGMYYVDDCPGSPYIPVYTFMMGVVIYSIVIVVPFIFGDSDSNAAPLGEMTSFRVCLIIVSIVGFAIQLSGWVVVYRDKGTFSVDKPCSPVLETISVVTTSIQCGLYVLFPLSAFLLYGDTVFWMMMTVLGYLSKITLALVALVTCLLPVVTILTGGISIDKCQGLYPELHVYLLGSGVCLLLFYLVGSLVCCCRSCGSTSNNMPYGNTGDSCWSSCVWICCVGFVLLLHLAFQCVGYAALYPYKLGHSLNSTDSTADNYCNEHTYNMSFATITLTTILCFYGPMILCVGINAN